MTRTPAMPDPLPATSDAPAAGLALPDGSRAIKNDLVRLEAGAVVVLARQILAPRGVTRAVASPTPLALPLCSRIHQVATRKPPLACAGARTQVHSLAGILHEPGFSRSGAEIFLAAAKKSPGRCMISFPTQKTQSYASG